MIKKVKTHDKYGDHIKYMTRDAAQILLDAGNEIIVIKESNSGPYVAFRVTCVNGRYLGREYSNSEYQRDIAEHIALRAKDWAPTTELRGWWGFFSESGNNYYRSTTIGLNSYIVIPPEGHTYTSHFFEEALYLP